MSRFLKNISLTVFALSAFSVKANFNSEDFAYFQQPSKCHFTNEINIGPDVYIKDIDQSIFFLGGSYEVLAPLYRRQDGLYSGDYICDGLGGYGELLDFFNITFFSEENMYKFAEKHNLVYIGSENKTVAKFQFKASPIVETPPWVPNDHGLAQANAEDMAVRANQLVQDSNVSSLSIAVKWQY
ncbi:hypothetical protein L1077_27145 [Pseudoalteromonas luteoviolacea]|uniref:hypothetical protein n=1 Tax=Pseudoalteromonas luteoviolacea TaxID=43657 RepID=UPI001F2AF327|nr:hypothetical protein [Pseudoalteromonas luteoviolacea]MCF6443104.1 hypothetical protein [Pseudoalteromonas luteoviolacea]